VRSATFAVPEFVALCRAHNVALVVADTAEWPYLDQTADFTYCRLQGPPDGARYSEADLDRWAGRFRALAEGRGVDGPTIAPAPAEAPPERDVFAYFVATDKPNAPGNAMAMQRRLGLEAAAD
jgi:uncharacterized protein YecE (DUF72 family)